MRIAEFAGHDLFDGNRLVRNSATGCDGCFEIGGDGNRLIRNLAYDGPGVGFWIIPNGENNQLIHNVAECQYKKAEVRHPFRW